MGVDVKLQSDSFDANAKGKTFLFFGLGYVARALLPSLQAKGFQVFATARTAKAAKACQSLGVTPIPFNGEASNKLKTVLKKSAYIVSSIPPNADGDPVLNALGENWEKLAPNLQWAGYLSATSVYGDRNGQWVFEEELLYPSSSRGKYRVRAELDWCESGAPVHLFRLAGIYGPGRNAFARVRADNAKAIIKEGHVSSRIHVDDIVSALLLSMKSPNPLRIYNLADDTPCPPQDVLNYAASLLDITLPQVPFEDADMSPLARSFYNDLRRTSNERVKQELGWELKYTSYKEGLASIFKSLAD